MAASFDPPLGESDLLLLYLSGELTGKERQEMDQRLSADSDLRERLESLREAHDRCAQLFETSKQDINLPTRQAALRRTSRLFAEWAEKRRPPLLIPSLPQRRAIPWTRYGLAAAAAILMAALGRSVIAPTSPAPLPRGPLAAAPLHLSNEDELAPREAVWLSLEVAPPVNVKFGVLALPSLSTDANNVSESGSETSKP